MLRVREGGREEKREKEKERERKREKELEGECALHNRSYDVGTYDVGLLSRIRSTTATCVCCSVLQCVAVCCSVLQCVAVCCSVL